jgi:hypothetical protein
LVKSELPKADLNLDPKIFSAAGVILESPVFAAS